MSSCLAQWSLKAESASTSACGDGAETSPSCPSLLLRRTISTPCDVPILPTLVNQLTPPYSIPSRFPAGSMANSTIAYVIT